MRIMEESLTIKDIAYEALENLKSGSARPWVKIMVRNICGDFDQWRRDFFYDSLQLIASGVAFEDVPLEEGMSKINAWLISDPVRIKYIKTALEAVGVTRSEHGVVVAKVAYFTEKQEVYNETKEYLEKILKSRSDV